MYKGKEGKDAYNERLNSGAKDLKDKYIVKKEIDNVKWIDDANCRSLQAEVNKVLSVHKSITKSTATAREYERLLTNLDSLNNLVKSKIRDAISKNR